MEKQAISLEERIARLEGRLGWLPTRIYLEDSTLLISLLFSISALTLSLLGLGSPNHIYQFALAAMLVAILYHRETLAYPVKWWGWSVSILNCFVLSVILKLFLGGGERRPFFWMIYPSVASEEKQADSWLNIVPDLSLKWQESSAAQYSIDLTIVQTFLLMITLLGALFNFQPFVSLTAFFLVIVSIPALVGFNWDYVFPAIMLAGVSFYLQSRSFNEKTND